VDFVKVLDFGLARQAPPEADPRLTGAGMRVGTPGYMAPEQIFDLAPEPRTDLYALGCVAYWLLAGVQPFDGRTPGEVARLHAQIAPPPPSIRGGRALPPRLEAVVMACLAKEPAERPADADALNDALGRSLDERPWSQAEARSWWSQNLAGS
jgi:serine/threonine-protein kinase